MSTYCMSDLHGQYKTFRRMLEIISFSKSDTLYILGDVIDRGPDGIKIIQDIMGMPNVTMFIGNHELLMLDALANKEALEDGSRTDTDDIDLWADLCNGGTPTSDAFASLSAKKRKDIISFIRHSVVAKQIKVGRKSYYLSHAYVTDRRFTDEIRFDEMTHKEVWDVVWQSVYEPEFVRKKGKALFPDKKKIYVGGHTFTQRLDCMDEKGFGKIYHNKNYNGFHVINVDCGMALKNKSSCLGCLRLEDDKEFYVPLM